MINAIVGAGPTGLYSALVFAKAGKKGLVIFDPRAGEYTRPGHLHEHVLTKAEEGIAQKLGISGLTHIKDFERKLYAMVLALGVRIEKKKFVRMQGSEQAPGIIVVDNEGVEEYIRADYVYDCTGSQRQVVHAVNALYPQAFKLSTFADLPIKNHFLGYVRISETDDARLLMATTLYKQTPELVNSLNYAQSIIKLRALGWNEFVFPRCYGVNFGKNKYCYYLQTPQNLAAENHDLWFQTVLDSYTFSIFSKSTQFEHLPPSKKYASKPRFTPFSVNAQALDNVSFRTKDLPTVIALGDAQIDPDYFLAHGVYHGMFRTDALLDSLSIVDGKINNFDESGYSNAIQDYLAHQKKVISSKAEELRVIFLNAIDLGKLHFEKAIMRSNDEAELVGFKEVLQELELRQIFIKAISRFYKYHSSDHILNMGASVAELVTILLGIQADLEKALSGLGQSYASELAQARLVLSALARSWKEIGNEFYKKSDHPQANAAYKNALKIYDLSEFKNEYHQNELAVYSNLVILHLNTKCYVEAIKAAIAALKIMERYPSEPKPGHIYGKVTFNLVTALCAHTQELIAEKPEEAKAFLAQATQLIPVLSTVNPENHLNAKQMVKNVQETLNKTKNMGIQNGLGLFSPPRGENRIGIELNDSFCPES